MPTTQDQTLICNHKKYPVKILYLPKKNSSASIKNGEIVLRLSKYLSKRQQQEHTDVLLAKIKKKLDKSSQAPWDISLDDGSLIEVFGQRLMLHIEYKPDAGTVRIKISKQAIILTHPYERLSPKVEIELYKKIRRKLAVHSNPELDGLVRDLNDRTVASRKLKLVKFKEQTSRWGSCSSNGNINISSRLLFLPVELLEYVCLHELCHLKHPDHSDKFWKLVEEYTPDFKKRRKQLQKYV